MDRLEQALAVAGEVPLRHLDEQFLLAAGGVVIQRGVVNADLGGNISQRDGIVTFLGKQLFGCADEVCFGPRRRALWLKALQKRLQSRLASSYAELLINDYSRRSFIDGRALCLPTIVVRPGKPNQAASTFASSIIREPLQGQRAVCPVAPQTRMWILSPRRAVEAFIHALELPAAAWGQQRTVALPGLSVSIGEIVASLEDLAGTEVIERISWQPDPFIQKLIDAWPAKLAARQAEALGFKADNSITQVIQAFIEDELSGIIKLG